MLEYYGKDTILSPFYVVDDVEEFLDDNGPQRLAAVHDAIGRLRILGDMVLVESSEPFLTLEETGQVFLTPAMPPEQLALVPDDERRSVITFPMTDMDKVSELALSLGVNLLDAKISGLNFDMRRPDLFRHDGVCSMAGRVSSDISDMLADDIGQWDAVDVRRWLSLRDAPHALDMRSLIKAASALCKYLPEGDLRRLAEIRLKACWKMLED